MAKQTVATPPRPVRTTPARQTPTRQTPLSPRAKKAQAAPVKPFQMPFDQKNIRLILIGVGVILVGYLLMWKSPVMSDMALTVSPIILLIGYCIIIPMGIMAGTKTFKRTTPLTEPPAANGTA